MSANSLYVLRPYPYQGSWVFDDPAVGLEREPFVFGIDEILSGVKFFAARAERQVVFESASKLQVDGGRPRGAIAGSGEARRQRDPVANLPADANVTNREREDF